MVDRRARGRRGEERGERESTCVLGVTVNGKCAHYDVVKPRNGPRGECILRALRQNAVFRAPARVNLVRARCSLLLAVREEGREKWIRRKRTRVSSINKRRKNSTSEGEIPLRRSDESHSHLFSIYRPRESAIPAYEDLTRMHEWERKRMCKSRYKYNK